MVNESFSGEARRRPENCRTRSIRMPHPAGDARIKPESDAALHGAMCRMLPPLSNH
ncbi:hypothetical protein BOSEA31B_10137 [Hyphomicrobiales bacterium]|nr:hypothetical protein BOSEA31B_10137 [Hyphomicrobiales bacterium]CAI0345972.1 hypothetical protein BO1005MUT1_470130 [Hyphomicrobiales bacterium]